MPGFVDRVNLLPRVVRILSTLLWAIAGGVVALYLGVPLPWLLGSLFVVAAISLFGVQTGMPDYVRKAGQIMAGLAVGLFFTPAVAAHVLQLGWIMVVSSLCSVFASVGIALLLAGTAGCDRSTAYFAMLPGGLAEMAGFAQQFKANVAQVSLSQTLRVVVIVVLLPNLLLLIDSDVRTGQTIEHPTMGYGLTSLALIVATGVAWVFAKVRIFNPWLLGGLATGITLGLAMSDSLYAPKAVSIVAQVAIGAALGSRLLWPTIRSTNVRFVPITMIATTLLIAVNCGLALVFSEYVALSTGILATAPGGIAEMSLTAEAMFLAPALVTAWQLVRIILVALLAGPLYLWYARILVKS